MKLSEYLEKYFPGLEIKQPLFYNWDYGIRFEIGYLDVWQDKKRGILNDLYLKTAFVRAKKIFEFLFKPEDEVIVVCQRYSDGRQKIKKRSFCYRNIKHYSSVESVKIRNLYDDCEPVRKKEHWHRKVFYTQCKYIDYMDFLYRSIRYDFGFGGVEVYFINVTRHLIYNNYDDRGLDVIASNVEVLRPLYEKYNEWILDYDRERIDKIFQSGM